MSHCQTVVIVVEDNSFIRAGVLDSVAAAGFEVLGAGSAAEAIRILEARPDIHIVFTDVGMPGTMDGMKLSHYTRHRWPPVKLMVTSGKFIVDESHLPVGAMFFPKPYDEGAIIEAMMGMPIEANGQHMRF